MLLTMILFKFKDSYHVEQSRGIQVFQREKTWMNFREKGPGPLPRTEF